MLATLIPFFLAARLTVDESLWKHGPEYVFDVDVTTNSRPRQQDLGVQNVGNLFCRPKGSDVLNCRFGNRGGRLANLTDDNNDVDAPEKTDLHLNEDPFEIKFNDRGIEYLIVNDRVHTAVLNNMKQVVQLLSFGVDLIGAPDGRFSTVENTTIGQCNATVYLSRYELESRRIKLEALPQLTKGLGEVIVIDKTPSLNNCSCYAQFLYGSYGHKVVEPSLHSRLERTTTQIYVSDVQFMSSLRTLMTMGSDPSNFSRISQYIKLVLRDVRAAKREMTEVTNASRTSIIANSDVVEIVAK